MKKIKRNKRIDDIEEKAYNRGFDEGSKKQLSKLKDQNEFLKDTNRELGRYETKRVKKIQEEHRKKFEWLIEKLSFVDYEQEGYIIVKILKKLIDKASKEK